MFSTDDNLSEIMSFKIRIYLLKLFTGTIWCQRLVAPGDCTTKPLIFHSTAEIFPCLSKANWESEPEENPHLQRVSDFLISIREIEFSNKWGKLPHFQMLITQMAVSSSDNKNLIKAFYTIPLEELKFVGVPP